MDDLNLLPSDASHVDPLSGDESSSSDSSLNITSNKLSDDGSSSGSNRKRRLSDEELYPLKRREMKTDDSLSRNYLQLLNTFIAETASGQIEPDTNEPPFETSQLGFTVWSGDEKAHFFDLLDRLGKDDVPEIARRLGTKGELEVLQFLINLEDARSFHPSLDVQPGMAIKPVMLVDIPAATEISPQLEDALKDAADDVATCQDSQEHELEKAKWEGDNWLVTASLAERLVEQARKRKPSAKEDSELADPLERRKGTVELSSQPERKLEDLSAFFHLPTLLHLSESIFMNGGMQSNDNWRLVGADEPSIRATALEDFHNLVVMITKRIVATALNVASQRLHRSTHKEALMKPVVSPRDVRVGVQSLGMQDSPEHFWRTCARRLKLDVFRNEHMEEKGRPMDYKEIERELGVHANFIEHSDEDEDDDDDSTDDDTVEGDESEQEQHEETEADAMDMDESSQDEAEALIQLDMQEVVKYTATDTRADNKQAKATLRERIMAEMAGEEYADMMDKKKTREVEASLWVSVNKAPRVEVEDVDEEDEEVMMRVKGTLLGIQPAVPHMGDWREKVDYKQEWEDAS